MIWRKKEKKKAQYQFNSERVFLVATQPKLRLLFLFPDFECGTE